ncbi:MAG: RNA polymerase sigma factor [Myxococcales bacterium]
MPPTQPAEADLGELLARARLGDKAALETVLSSVAPAIHRFGLRMCKNAHDAEDVLQDTLLTLVSHLGDFEGRSSLSSWVFSVTRSACTRKRRGLKNRPLLGEEHLVNESATAPSPESGAADQELSMALSAALASLSDDQREVVLLRDVEGLTAPEAASALGVSVEALKSRLHRARAALRDALRPFLESSAPRATANCPNVVALWSSKLEGDLSQQDCSAMERHLLDCPSCAGACGALKQALLGCRQMGGEVSPEVQASVKDALRDWTAQRRI